MGAGIITLIIVCVLLQTCSAVRDPDATLLTLPGLVGVWNQSKYPASQFRDESVVGYFDIWPEYNLNVKLTYFCEDPRTGNLSLSNFTYSPTENQLLPMPYYDLGVVSSFQPYWRYWRFWHVDLKRISYPINCEYHDLHKLYLYRFWRVPLLQGFYAFLLMQAVVMAAVIVVMIGHRVFKMDENNEISGRKQSGNVQEGGSEQQGGAEPEDGTKQGGETEQQVGSEQRGGTEQQAAAGQQAGNIESEKIKGICWKCGSVALGMMMDLCRPWSRDWGHFLSELIHLGLVAEVGSCMLESIGYNPLRSWRATFMFNTAVVYTWMSLFAMLAATVRQITTGWDPDNSYSGNLKKGDRRDLSMGRGKWFAMQKLSDDWRWQRVFLQLGTLVLVGTFLTSVDDASGVALDQMAALLLAAAVVACTSSFAVSAVCLFRFLSILLRKLVKDRCPSCMSCMGYDREQQRKAQLRKAR